MTWRERIAEARERGAFTQADRDLWSQHSQCFVGEMRARFGLHFNLEMTKVDTYCECGPLQKQIQRALRGNDFDAAERLLDEVEDRALQLKREAQ